MAATAARPSSAGEIFHLALADAVLAGAGAVHGERALDQALDEGLGARELVGVAMSTSRVRWKLPSPTWPTIGAMSRLAAMSRWVSRDAFGQPRDRHADIGGKGLRARPQAACRPIGVVPRLPEPGALLGLVAQSNGPPPSSRAISPNRSDCSATPASLPWNSTNSIGGSGSVSLE